MAVDDPVVIVGTGRCGSSVLYELLTRHPRLAWLTHVTARFPDSPTVNRGLMRCLDFPLLSPLLLRWLKPSEAYRFWDLRFPGFSEPCRDLVSEDVTAGARRALRAAFEATLTSSRNRLLLKVTGWPRLGFIQEVFPEARFVHIYRDGRAVASSLLSRPWWRGWGGTARWRWGELPPEYQEKWERFGRSYVVLAGIQWELLMAAVERARTRVDSERLLELSYEDLCSDHRSTVASILDFAQLEPLPRFERSVERFSLVNSNDGWRQWLTPAQQRDLQQAIGPTLARYGYSGRVEEGGGVPAAADQR